MSYRYKAAEEYWKNFHELPSKQKESVRKAWKVFKNDPFHPSLKAHKIHKLSSEARHTIYSVVVEANLRVIFMIQEDLVYTLDVGNHDVYK